MCELSAACNRATVADIFQLNKVISRVKTDNIRLHMPRISRLENRYLECFSEASFANLNETYCYPATLLTAYRSQQAWYNHLLIVLIGLIILVVVLAIMMIRAHKMSVPRSFHNLTKQPLGPIGSGKAATNGRTNYYPAATGDADQLMTKIPFHDLTSDDEI
ncbi:hypothetical protein SK128_020941 [Halocaridina rubra]|uniref:Uncharacterized protein n=1 Tax=Halocaridina rubra TaxID=373956 RepID=A0AAN8X8C9_HALRR